MIKRIRCILFCLLPLIITLVLQILVSIPVCGVTVITALLKNYNHESAGSKTFNDLLSLWSSSSFIIWVSMLYAIAALILFGFWYYKKLAADQELVPVKYAFNIQIISSLFLLAAGLQYVVQYLMSFIGVVRPDWMQSYADLSESAGLGSMSPLTLVYACIIAPVSEELIFRGVTLGYAKKSLSVTAAIVLQAVLFGVFHMNIIQGIYAAFLGLFLGYLFEAGGSIAVAMLFHAFFNLCGSFFSPYMYYGIDQPFFFMLWLTVGVLLTYAGIFLFQHGTAVRDMK